MMGLIPDLCSADWRTSQPNPTKTIMSALKCAVNVRLRESLGSGWNRFRGASGNSGVIVADEESMFSTRNFLFIYIQVQIKNNKLKDCIFLY